MRRTLTTALIAGAGIMLASATASQAQTSKMVFIGRGAGGSADTYFLADTFKIVDARTRSAEIVLSYDKPRLGLTADYQDDPNQRFMSYKSTYYVHCADGQMATAYDTQLAGPRGEGPVVGKILGDAPPQEAWYRTPTDLYPAFPTETTIVKTICAYKAG